MPTLIEFNTARLRLRQWRESDRVPFATMNADAQVMEFFPSLQSRESSDASIGAWQSQFAERGCSNWEAALPVSNQPGAVADVDPSVSARQVELT